MERFFNTNHNVSNIVLACFVAAGTGATIHKNRNSHGLALRFFDKKASAFLNQAFRLFDKTVLLGFVDVIPKYVPAAHADL